MSSSTRGRAGKYSKAKRGGGRNFSKNLRPLDADGVEHSMWGEQGQKKEAASSSEDSDEDSEEDSSDDSGPAAQQEMTREERKAATKAKKDAAIKKKKGTPAAGDMPTSSEESSEDDEADGEMPANPNHSAAAQRMAAKAPVDPAAPPKKTDKKTDPSQLSRREREALQAQQSKERYQKLHAEGKTDEARADMERLKLVREQRNEAAAQKEAEKQEKALLDDEKKGQMERLDRQQALKSARGNRGGKKGGRGA
ncbi:hypothetical protein LTR08_005538 [Meristemomyces frigidus]|nr:hypothetical protein LTR08_005538 [Meristemomyces frigidus]